MPLESAPMRRLLLAPRTRFALAAAPVHAQQQQAVSIMHGFADMASMTLWVQTERAARVAVELHPDGEAAKRRRVEGATRAEDDFALHLRLAGLEPGTRYRYQVLVDGRPAGEPGTFATQPLWQYRTDPPDLAVAFGSCAYLNDRFSRPGPPWGGDYGDLRRDRRAARPISCSGSATTSTSASRSGRRSRA